MLEFKETEDGLFLIYSTAYGTTDWVGEKLDEGSVILARTFHLTRRDLVSRSETGSSTNGDDFGGSEYEGEEPGSYTFRLGSLADGYYRIRNRKLSIAHDVYLSTEMNIEENSFIAARNISIFRHIDKLVSEDIYIGGNAPNAMPLPEFARLLKTFPNSAELNHYAQARVARILKDYFETTTPAEKAFENYLGRRPVGRKIRAIPDVYKYEHQKYEFIKNTILESLKEEGSFGENEWRDLMLQFILLIFPKYVCVLRNVRIKDFYASPGHFKNRYIDLALVDANGHLDLIEIKKPFPNCLISDGLYRDNYTPRKDLSGAVMQAEKYLFHLNKWGVAGEDDINRRQTENLPIGLKVRITNPKAIIIAGRSNNLSTQQLFDFELIKRKYANMMDILSYDDLVARLVNIIEKFKTRP